MKKRNQGQRTKYARSMQRRGLRAILGRLMRRSRASAYYGTLTYDEIESRQRQRAAAKAMSIAQSARHELSR